MGGIDDIHTQTAKKQTELIRLVRVGADCVALEPPTSTV